MFTSWRRSVKLAVLALVLASQVEAAPPYYGWHGFGDEMTNSAGWADWAATNRIMDQLWEATAERIWVGGRKWGGSESRGYWGYQIYYSYSYTNTVTTNVTMALTGGGTTNVTFTNLMLKQAYGSTNVWLFWDGNTNWAPDAAILYGAVPETITLTNGVVVRPYLVGMIDPEVAPEGADWEIKFLATALFADGDGTDYKATVWPYYVVTNLAGYGGHFDDWFALTSSVAHGGFSHLGPDFTSGQWLGPDAHPDEPPRHSVGTLSLAAADWDPVLWAGLTNVSGYVPTVFGDEPALRTWTQQTNVQPSRALTLGDWTTTNMPLVIAQLHWVQDIELVFDASNYVYNLRFNRDDNEFIAQEDGTTRIGYRDGSGAYVYDGWLGQTAAVAEAMTGAAWTVLPAYTSIVQNLYSSYTTNGGVWSQVKSHGLGLSGWISPTTEVTARYSRMNTNGFSTGMLEWTGTVQRAWGQEGQEGATALSDTNAVALADAWLVADDLTFSGAGLQGDVITLAYASPVTAWILNGILEGPSWVRSVTAYQRMVDEMRWTYEYGHEETNVTTFSWAGYGWEEAEASILTNDVSRNTVLFDTAVAAGYAITSPEPSITVSNTYDGTTTCFYADADYTGGRTGWPVRVRISVVGYSTNDYVAVSYLSDNDPGGVLVDCVNATDGNGDPITVTPQIESIDPWVEALRIDADIRNPGPQAWQSATNWDPVHGPWASGKDLYLQGLGADSTNAHERAIWEWSVEAGVQVPLVLGASGARRYCYAASGAAGVGYCDWIEIAQIGNTMPFYQDTEWSKGWQAARPLWIYKFDVTNGLRRVSLP